jgi:hypothetical protein
MTAATIETPSAMRGGLGTTSGKSTISTTAQVTGTKWPVSP